MHVNIIIERNDRISLREHKELIQQVLYGNEKDSAPTESRKDMVSNFSIEQMGW